MSAGWTMLGLVLSERSYSYDVDGNRLTRSTISGGLPAVETYSYGPGFRLASIDDGSGPQTYGHDAGGRVNGFDGNTIGYDSLDHVTSVSRLSAGAANYSYTFDGEGRRVASTDGTLSREFLVAPNMVSAGAYESPMLVTDAGGSAVRSYVYAGEHAVMRVQDTGAGVEPTYYLRDAMGSVMALADSTGTRTARFEYDAFGEVDSATGADASLPAEGDFRHHGMWLDPTGLYYVRSRSYDANTGRFLTRDPVDPGMGVPEAWSPYVANLSNPLVYRDPEGLFTLLGISVSISIHNSARGIRASGASAAKDEVVDRLGTAIGEIIVGAIRSLLPAGIPDPLPSGAQFGLESAFNLCSVLPPALDTAAQGLHLDATIGADGAPQSEGYNCLVRLPTSLSGLGAAVDALPGGGATRPDFIYSRLSMADVRDKKGRSYLVGDFKRQINSGYPARGSGRERQLQAMAAHAANYGSRVAVLITLMHTRDHVVRGIHRAGLAHGVLILVASP